MHNVCDVWPKRRWRASCLSFSTLEVAEHAAGKAGGTAGGGAGEAKASELRLFLLGISKNPRVLPRRLGANAPHVPYLGPGYYYRRNGAGRRPRLIGLAHAFSAFSLSRRRASPVGV